MGEIFFWIWIGLLLAVAAYSAGCAVYYERQASRILSGVEDPPKNGSKKFRGRR